MIKLVDIDASNFRSVLKLEVDETQKKDVSSPSITMSRAYVYRETAKALAIYKDSILIGYTLIRSYDDTYCIDQFAIDKEYQNRGYGKSSFKMILDGLRDERRFEKVTLCHYDNSILSRFYENFGFRFSDMDEDEIILVLDLEK